MMLRNTIFFLLFLSAGFVQGQELSPEQIKARITTYKQDLRGPYRDIRWFCKDGTTQPPKEPCKEPGGVQRARYKDDVISLGKSNHIFLGQILATTDKTEFWDAANHHSRLKQYQLEKFLRAADDGWVLRKAQYYRGAYQAEDEQAWGAEFLTGVLADDQAINREFYLLYQAVKDIPHQKDDNKTLQVRAVSKTIADEYPAFMDIRVKIHGQPDEGDIALVQNFRDKNRTKLSAELLKKMDQLIADMKSVYRPVDMAVLQNMAKGISGDPELSQKLSAYFSAYRSATTPRQKFILTAEQSLYLRERMPNVKSGKTRLAMMDVLVKLEELLFRESAQWQPETVAQLLEKIYYQSMAVTATGYLEVWEWQKVAGSINPGTIKSMDLVQLTALLENARGVVEWGTGMVHATYDEEIEEFGKFEPLTFGFVDDRVRSSGLLNLGNSIGQLGDFIAGKAKLTNKVMDLQNQSQIRGVNPGYAMGELVVVTGDGNSIEVSPGKIYIFNRPPSDLKPVAGIATVSEGNMVSHIQLLARNLGIPNAVISLANLQDLRKYSGKKVFYAVSNKGTVIMKPAENMTQVEKELFAVKVRKEEKITVPVERVRLDQKTVLNLRQVKATDSGILCGPKAANLGELKRLFPQNVVEGFVIPFGIFRDHMDLEMPGQECSYWTYLNDLFESATIMRQNGKPEEEVETFTLDGLSTLRTAIKTIELKPAFLADIKQSFRNILGKDIGKVPVFLRSDTNMEDLKDFTGAGLNLTVFNVADEAKIIQGIKDVWASPYSERSYKWRQKYLLNPENVFPSILVIPSVDVEYSGVLITKGIRNGEPKDLTIAFSRGAGGAVDGQAAESYLLKSNGQNVLLSPAREPFYNRLPASGGTAKKAASFEKAILNSTNLSDIRSLASQVRQKMGKSEDSDHPFDVELGFKNNEFWLFQIRPFVENKRAVSSTYLQSITPEIPDYQVNLQSSL